MVAPPFPPLVAPHHGCALACRYLITSLALVPRGTEGAVSLEGTLAGLAAAAALAGVAVLAGMVSRTATHVTSDVTLDEMTSLRQVFDGDCKKRGGLVVWTRRPVVKGVLLQYHVCHSRHGLRVYRSSGSVCSENV